MTKYAFLARLEAALAALDAEERREALRYYEEYFEDNEGTPDTLRSPEEIAAELLTSYGVTKPEKPQAEAQKPPEEAPKASVPIGRVIGAVALILLIFTLGAIALGMICAAAALFGIACFLLQLNTAVAVTAFGTAILVTGLFGLSLGGTIKSAKAASQLFKNCKGGESA